MEDFEAAEGEKPSDPGRLMCPLPPSPCRRERVKPSENLHQIQVICSAKQWCTHLQRGHRDTQSSNPPKASLHSSRNRQGIKMCGCNQIIPSKK